MKVINYILISFILFIQNGAYGAMPTIDVSQIAQTITMIKDNAKYHVETALKWKKNFDLVKTQIDQVDKLREAIGNPKELAQDIGWDWWHDRDIDAFHEQQYVFNKLRYDSDGLRSLGYTSKGLYKEAREKDKAGNKVERDIESYKRHDIIEKQYETLHEVNEATAEIKKELQKEALEVMGKMKNATTDAEVQALNTKINSINGQLALVQNLRQDEINRLQAQDILNKNQKEKEMKAAREDFDHERNALTQKAINFFKTIKLTEDK